VSALEDLCANYLGRTSTTHGGSVATTSSGSQSRHQSSSTDPGSDIAQGLRECVWRASPRRQQGCRPARWAPDRPQRHLRSGIAVGAWSLSHGAGHTRARGHSHASCANQRKIRPDGLAVVSRSGASNVTSGHTGAYRRGGVSCNEDSSSRVPRKMHVQSRLCQATRVGISKTSSAGVVGLLLSCPRSPSKLPWTESSWLVASIDSINSAIKPVK